MTELDAVRQLVLNAIDKELKNFDDKIAQMEAEIRSDIRTGVEHKFKPYITTCRIKARLERLKSALQQPNSNKSGLEIIESVRLRMNSHLVNWEPTQTGSPISNLIAECDRRGDQIFLELLDGAIGICEREVQE